GSDEPLALDSRAEPEDFAAIDVAHLARAQAARDLRQPRLMADQHDARAQRELRRSRDQGHSRGGTRIAAESFARLWRAVADRAQQRGGLHRAPPRGGPQRVASEAQTLEPRELLLEFQATLGRK